MRSAEELLSWQIPRLFVAYQQLVARELATAGLDNRLTPGMGPLLWHLFAHDGDSVGDIALALACSKATVSSQVQALLKAGLATRKRQRGDKRLVQIQLTSEGRALAEAGRGVLARVEAALRAPFAAWEAHELLTRMSTLGERLRGEMSSL